MSNLEPIEEKDLDLASKFGEVSKMGGAGENKTEKPDFEPEKETAKEVVSAEKDSAYNQILSKIKSQQTPGATEEDVKGDAARTSLKQDAESQIQHLVDIALEKGVIHAVNVAKHLEDNYVLDMFHDKLLSDELHEALMKKGLIEEA
jgi:predicted nucleotidyltransferase